MDRYSNFLKKNNFEVWFLEKGFQSQEMGKCYKLIVYL